MGLKPRTFTVRDLVETIQNLSESNQGEADTFLEQYVSYMESNNSQGWDRDKCREVCLSNIGYCAGYIDVAAMQKVGRMFGARHPVFG